MTAELSLGGGSATSQTFFVITLQRVSTSAIRSDWGRHECLEGRTLIRAATQTWCHTLLGVLIVLYVLLIAKKSVNLNHTAVVRCFYAGAHALHHSDCHTVYSGASRTLMVLERSPKCCRL